VTIVDPFPLAEDTDAKATDVQGKWDALREAVEGIGCGFDGCGCLPGGGCDFDGLGGQR